MARLTFVAIASLTSEMGLQASPRGGLEADFEALKM